jgi:hypothetical protein
LKPYKDIAAVGLIWNNLVQVDNAFHYEEGNARTVEFGYPTFKMKPEVAMKVEKFLTAIQNQYAVVFNYTKVGIGAMDHPGRRDSIYKEQQIYPLQIRSHLGRLYIVGALFKKRVTPGDIRIFPIDAIGRGPDKHEIDTPSNQDEESNADVNFGWESVVKRTGLKDYYTNAIGIYRDYTLHERPIRVSRWFIGWAANWVNEFPIHSTQEIIKKDENGNILILIEVYDTPDIENFLARFGEFCMDQDKYKLYNP